MGIYYRAVDVKRKQYFDPPGGHSIRYPGICHPDNPFPGMVVMKNGAGCDFEICNDMQEYIYHAEGFEDVTENVYKRYCELWEGLGEKDS